MRRSIALWMTALSVIAALALPSRVAAQHPKNQPSPYILIDLGTFGGPQSFMAGLQVVLNDRGMVVGQAETTIPEPNFNPGVHFSADPVVQHAFVWSKGVVTDLGAQLDPNSSGAGWINQRGDAAGASEDGTIDPLMGFPAAQATLWQDGRAIRLGTLGGYESASNAVNNRDQVVGGATNTIPDTTGFFSQGTQLHAFLWQRGVMHDLGTLGGPDSDALVINDRGQVAGNSYTNATPISTTGFPTVDPYLWQDGHMQDLGTLGGAFGQPNAINSAGLVAGQSNLPGDQIFHPFLWQDGHMQDLGTLGGDYGSASWLNNRGTVVGWATTPENTTAHAVLWQNGVTRDLGVPLGDDYSVGEAINQVGQVVGNAGAFGALGHGFLWAHGRIIDVNTLVTPSDLHVTEATFINDQGEIAGNGVLPNGQQHALLMIPTHLAESEGLTSNAPVPGTVAPVAALRTSASRCLTIPIGRAWLSRQMHLPCFGPHP